VFFENGQEAGMRLKTRKRLSLLILVLGLPAYIIVAVILVNWMDDRWGRQPIWIELAVYVLLGVIWILPLRRVFTGIGREE
jgi:predicted membrane channel-forming protein YqfA (hemolysin III family)|tara:strand:- start:184 stop:426 length:243 start_codon:yes stop_codon:yes gene_type:complete